MTIKELGRYYYTMKNITEINNRIEELNSLILGASKLSDIKVSGPKSKQSKPEQYTELLIKLQDLLIMQRIKSTEQEIKINEFLDTIEDKEVEYIIRNRFLKFKSWYDISAEMGVTRTAPYKKVKKFLENIK